MRILVYGAGVIGANLAADLYASGRDVTILARGNWAHVLEHNGLCHAAFVLPVAFACYHCGGDLKQIKNDRAYLTG